MLIFLLNLGLVLITLIFERFTLDPKDNFLLAGSLELGDRIRGHVAAGSGGGGHAADNTQNISIDTQ